MNIPNKITLLRVMLIPFFVASLMLEYRHDHLRLIALGIFALACLTDALDGLIAKSSRQTTRLGNLMDPLADKLLLISGYLALTFLDTVSPRYRIPEWLTLLVLFRDVILIAGAFIIYALYNRFEARPNRVGKATTFIQMCCILLALYGLEGQWRGVVYQVTAFMTIISGVLYMRLGAQIFSNGGEMVSEP